MSNRSPASPRTHTIFLEQEGSIWYKGTEGGDYREQRYDLNLLYGWEFRPGSMFYLAYNQPLERVDGESDLLDPLLVAKVTYLLSL